MDRNTASEVANSWLDLAQHDEELSSEYGRLAQFLASMLPDDTEKAAGALVSGAPGVVALAGDGFFLVTFDERQEGQRQPLVERLPLDANVVGLHVVEELRSDVPGPRDPFGGSDEGALTREWTLSWPGGRRVSFLSVVRRFRAFHGGPDAAEAFARVLAARLGWNLPE